MKSLIYSLCSLALTSLAYSGTVVSNNKTFDTSSNSSTENRSIPPCPSMVSCMQDQGKYNIYGDYLFWEVRQDGLQFAGDVGGDFQAFVNLFATGTGPSNVKIREKEPHFKWRSGFRIGTGYDLPCDTWNFDLFWTRLHSCVTTHVSNSNQGLYPLQFPAAGLFNIIQQNQITTQETNTAKTLVAETTNSDIKAVLSPIVNVAAANNSIAQATGVAATPFLGTGAKNKWCFSFDTVDLQVGKTFYPGQWVGIKPYLGVKAAWIHQRSCTNFYGFTTAGLASLVPLDNTLLALANQLNISPETALPLQVYGRTKNDFDGVGPSFGVNSMWKFASDWSVETNISLAALYGQFKTETFTSIIGGVQPLSTSVPRTIHRIRPTMGGFAGIRWERCVTNFMIMTASVGYEIQYWWNQWQAASSNQTDVLDITTEEGDLMLQGITAKIGFSF